MDSNKKINKEIIKKRIFPTILISIIFPVMMWISISFEIYSNNLEEFVFTLSDFIYISIGFSLVLFIFNFFVLIFLPMKAYKIVSSIILSFSVMFFIQSNYLNKNMNSLAGDNMAPEGLTKTDIILNVILWCVVIITFVIFACLKDKKNIFSSICLILSLMVASTQIISPISIAITNKDLYSSKTDRLNTVEGKGAGITTNKDLNAFAKDKNIFYFVVDRFDERYAEEALKENPDMYKNLNGFTWFQDNISIYGHTYPAIANMLTRNSYVIEYNRKDFLKSVYKNNDTLSVLANNGYDINLYTHPFYAYGQTENLPKYIKNVSNAKTYDTKKPTKLSVKMMEMSLYRGLPFVLKNLFGDINSSTCNQCVSIKDENGFESYSCDNYTMRDYALNSKFIKKEGKNFQFIHFDGCHQVLENKALTALDVSFEIINKYIKEMKNLGIYNDATIVITGDHSAPFNDFKDVNEPRLTALFVKQAGQFEGDLKTSRAQTSHDNIWPTIMKSEGIEISNKYGKSVFDIKENETIKRRFIWHTYGFGLREYTYEIIGSGNNFSNWKEIANKSFDKSLMD